MPSSSANPILREIANRKPTKVGEQESVLLSAVEKLVQAEGVETAVAYLKGVTEGVTLMLGCTAQQGQQFPPLGVQIRRSEYGERSSLAKWSRDRDGESWQDAMDGG